MYGSFWKMKMEKCNPGLDGGEGQGLDFSREDQIYISLADFELTIGREEDSYPDITRRKFGSASENPDLILGAF